MQEKLTEGAYGLIYKGVDLMSPLQKFNRDDDKIGQKKNLLNSNGALIYQPIIFKFTQQIEVNDMEFAALEEILKQAESAGKRDLILRTMIKGSVVVLDNEFVNSSVK